MPYSLLLVFALFQPQADWQPTLRNLEWREVKSLWVTVDASRPIEDWLDAQQRTQFSCNLAHGKVLADGKDPSRSHVKFWPVVVSYYGHSFGSNLCDPVQLPTGISSEDALQALFYALNDSLQRDALAYEDRDKQWRKLVASYERELSIREKQVDILEHGLEEIRQLSIPVKKAATAPR